MSTTYTVMPSLPLPIQKPASEKRWFNFMNFLAQGGHFKHKGVGFKFVRAIEPGKKVFKSAQCANMKCKKPTGHVFSEPGGCLEVVACPSCRTYAILIRET